jgi:hypothetical protein
MKTTLKSLVPFFIVLLAIVVSSSCDPIVDPPKQTISYERADSMENNFTTTRSPVIRQYLGYEDTRDFWFSLDTLKKYIEYVEFEAKKKKRSNLGVRVYFAAYPPSKDGVDSLGYATVFFAPTAQQEHSPLKQGLLPFIPENENIDGINALNYGGGGIPPNNY